jgi:hypothetical protein
VKGSETYALAPPSPAPETPTETPIYPSYIPVSPFASAASANEGNVNVWAALAVVLGMAGFFW